MLLLIIYAGVNRAAKFVAQRIEYLQVGLSLLPFTLVVSLMYLGLGHSTEDSLMKSRLQTHVDLF